jgi:hypothetical protein
MLDISQLKDLKALYFIMSHMGMNGFVFCMLPQYCGRESQAIILHHIHNFSLTQKQK